MTGFAIASFFAGFIVGVAALKVYQLWRGGKIF